MSTQDSHNINTLQQVYLVGGAVRDQLLGMPSFDKDYVVVGETPARMKALGFIPVGKDFPVFLHPITKAEYALARTEKKTSGGYTGFSVDASKAVTLTQDLARRDLTINAMASDEHGNIIDPYNGQADINNKILRHTTAAFIEDPVRVLRVARFLARFGPQWQIHPSTIALFKRMHEKGELSHLVAERVWKETEKALQEPYPHLYFETLMGLDIFPELEAMQNVRPLTECGSESDVFTHTMLSIKQAANLQFDLPTRFAVLTLNFGKPSVFQQQQHFLGHEQAGKVVIEVFCQRLRVPNKIKELALLSCEYHLWVTRLIDLKPDAIYTLMVENLNAVKQPLRFMQFINACECNAQEQGELDASAECSGTVYAKYLLNGIIKVNTKAAVIKAQQEGLSGIAVGQAVRKAQLMCIKQLVTHYHSHASS
ncbi:MAG: multifunctional CCA addition/repair protein [Glaciecola sp.]